MAGNVPTVSFISAWTKFTTTHSDELIVELSRSINVSLSIIKIVLHFVLIQGADKSVYKYFGLNTLVLLYIMFVTCNFAIGAL